MPNYNAQVFVFFIITVAAAEVAVGLAIIVALYREAATVETLITGRIASLAGAAVADTLVFEVLAPTDWVRKSLEGLTPVDAGRFVVHGSHDRACVRANRSC